MCIKQVELAQPHAMVRTDLDGLQERCESAVQQIVDLEERLLRAKEKKFQPKRDVKVRSP